MRTTVIAEIGSAWRYGKNHWEHGIQAIRVAKAAGADCVKFQWTSDPRKMEKRRKVKKGSYDILNWPKAWIADFYGEAERLGIEFMCTVFLPEDVAVIDPYVKRFKVASLESDATDLTTALGLYASPAKKDIIWSYGASKDWHWNGLHCTVAYPALPNELNLLAIENCNFRGYSDHSGDLLTGALAVACGAGIVESHFRLDCTPKDNPDYGHSHSPGALKQYIQNIRKAEVMLGDGIKKIEASEQWALKHKVKT